MNKVVFEGVRCFHDYHSSPLKPLTLLVGENSSGKSTFLALTRIAWDITEGDLSGDLFNEEPFLLGSYDQIASYRGGKAGRAKSFRVGMEIPLNLSQKHSELFSDNAVITAKFIPAGSEPKLEEWRFECGQFSLVATTSQKSKGGLCVSIKTPIGTQDIEYPYFRSSVTPLVVLRNLRFELSERHRPKKGQQPILTDAELKELQGFTSNINRRLGLRPYAFAPIRTRPLRTYDPLKEVPKPEGSHVPMVLSKYLEAKTGGNSDLKEDLTSFGIASGLFNSLEVKRKGSKESDPFQIVVKTIGPTFNLVDVGYGVSQVLPIVVDVLQNPNGSTFLLQQPEVHLHPKAQAELGSFLTSLAKEREKGFIIETHSDYLIDRIRMDVRDKKIKTEDVLILYFEKKQGGVNIYELNLDEIGNIMNVPPTYRQFFLEEERRMLEV